MFRAATLVVLLAILGTGLAFLVLRAAGPSRSLEIILPTASPPGEAVVYVTGAVQREGVYTLREGDRVADAVQAAGGLAPEADRARVNLAARLADEEHIHVPRTGEAAPPALAGSAGSVGRLIDINSATQKELEGLPEIGPKLAQAIIDYRSANGPFSRIEDLLQVPRIGEGILEQVRPFITAR